MNPQMDPRQAAQKFLSNFNLQNAKDKIIRRSQLSKDSGGYEFPGAMLRRIITEMEEEDKQIFLTAKNNIVSKKSIQELREIEQRRRIQEHKQNIRSQVNKALLENPAVDLNTNQVINDSWLPGQASAAAHAYKENILSYAIEASRTRNIPIQKAVQEAVQNVSPSSYLGNVPLNAGETTQIATAAYNPYFQQLLKSDELGFTPQEAFEYYSQTDPHFLYGSENMNRKARWKEHWDDYDDSELF
jgi:hypothetical protein